MTLHPNIIVTLIYICAAILGYLLGNILATKEIKDTRKLAKARRKKKETSQAIPNPEGMKQQPISAEPYCPSMVSQIIQCRNFGCAANKNGDCIAELGACYGYIPPHSIKSPKQEEEK